MDTAHPSTREKALALNLDPAAYGTFAEIGAGQEVARWFFHVRGAAGTVAKTISAYDMAVRWSVNEWTPPPGHPILSTRSNRSVTGEESR